MEFNEARGVALTEQVLITYDLQYVRQRESESVLWRERESVCESKRERERERERVSSHSSFHSSESFVN